MLKIRLKRVGRKNDPSFRVVLMDSRSAARSGKDIEILGSYNPRRETPPVLKNDRIKHWIEKGAKLSGVVNNLLLDAGIIKGYKVNVSPKQKKKQTAESQDAPGKKEKEKPEI